MGVNDGNKPQTVAEYFAQFAEKGHIFDEPLEVILKCGEPAKIHAIVPRQEYPIKGCAQTEITDFGSNDDLEWDYKGECSWVDIDVNIVAIPSLGINDLKDM